jgi:hypothetical protein
MGYAVINTYNLPTRFHQEPDFLACSKMEAIRALAIEGVGLGYMPDFPAHSAIEESAETSASATIGGRRLLLGHPAMQPASFAPSARLRRLCLREFVQVMRGVSVK